jgi:UDP-N-acetylglucosamine--N-acetylmuramyl-(pentapeptide) pyrophosphoryl-undecaprenol N-acetylglucosamine transferase
VEPLNVIFTCGGTGGHIYPAVAVAKLLRERQPNAQILFIGAEGGMEENLVPREGFALETLKISSFLRQPTPKALWHNAETLVHMEGSLRKADQIIRRFHPDVIVGTGGYASYPALHEGARLGVPTAVHESNAVPGLTTRMVEKKVTRILVSYEQSREKYSDPSRVVVTGTPVRGEFLYTRREDARKSLGLDDRPLVVSCWGSLGAREMNKKIAQFMKRECEAKDPFRHIHATGSYGWRWMPAYVKELGVELSGHPALDMREFIYDMPRVAAAADLMICRSGAATLAEAAVSATPLILVPSPNVTDNHQEKNARVFEQAGAAILLREAECDGDRLFDTAAALLQNPEKLRAMRAAAASLAVVDASERIYKTVLELAGTR